MAACALVALCGCSGDGDPPPPPPVSAPVMSSTIDVTVGAAPTVRAEVADTPAERSRGLMGRRQVAPGTGMLFVFAGPSTSSFYMWRTLVPLSIVFVDVDRVVGVAEMTPCAAATAAACPRYPAEAPYTLAIEAPGGWFTAAGVQSGDPVTLEPPPAPATS